MFVNLKMVKTLGNFRGLILYLGKSEVIYFGQIFMLLDKFSLLSMAKYYINGLAILSP